MKRSLDKSSNGIVKFFIRQGPMSEPQAEPVSDSSVNVPVEKGHEKDSLSKSNKNKQRLTGFNQLWKKDFPWVDEYENGMKCKLCIRHQKRPKRAPVGKASWVDVPCTWVTRDSITRHQKSDTHKEAMSCEALRTRPAQTVENRIENMGSLYKQARVVAFRNLYWLMKHEIPHTTIYKPLLQLCVEHGVSVLNNMNNGDNDKGESQRFIQEAVLVIGRQVQQPVIDHIQASPWFSVLVDETTDVAVVKEMVMYIRYLKDGVSQTDFLAMVPLHDGTATSITEAILDQLNKFELPAEKICALGSDGASVMVGKRNGVGAMLRGRYPHILSNHCVAHRLALAVAQAAKEIKYLNTFKDVLGQLHRFYEYSAIRMDGLHQIQELYNDRALKLSQAKDVRWLSHDQATRTLKRCFPAVLTSLEREAQERSNTTACGLSVFLRKYNFIASLMMMCDVLPHMSALSKAMQTRDAVYTTIGPLVTGTLSIIRQLQEQPGQHFSAVDETIQSLRHQGFDIAEPTQDEMEKFKRNVYDKFHSQLVENLEARFPDLPLIGNFGAFDLRDVNDDIDTHGNEQLKELAQHFTLPDIDVNTEWRQVKAAVGRENYGMDYEKPQ